MAFEDELRKRDIFGQMAGGGYTPTPAPMNGLAVPAAPNMSPEASATMRAGGGGSVGGTETGSREYGPGQEPGMSTPEPQPYRGPAGTNGTPFLNYGVPNTGKTGPQPTVPGLVPVNSPPLYEPTARVPTIAQNGPPLQLYNRPPTEQAATLTNYLRSLGVTLPPTFNVGGTSPVDGQINNLIDLINGSTNPAERKAYGEQIAQLMGVRNSSATNPSFRWNTATNQAETITRTPGQLIGGLAPPNGTGGIPTLQPTVPRVDPKILEQLLALFASGGVTDEQKTAQESQLVSELEQGAGRRRQLLADRLGAQGISGGAAVDALNQVGNETDAARASGLAQIRTGILGLQQRARETALAAVLQQMGMASNEAQQIASLFTQRQIAQAQLAQGGEQFQQNLGLQTLNLQNNQSGQRMNMIIALLQLENMVDVQDRGAIQHLIDTFLSGGA